MHSRSSSQGLSFGEWANPYAQVDCEQIKSSLGVMDSHDAGEMIKRCLVSAGEVLIVQSFPQVAIRASH